MNLVGRADSDGDGKLSLSSSSASGGMELSFAVLGSHDSLDALSFRRGERKSMYSGKIKG